MRRWVGSVLLLRYSVYCEEHLQLSSTSTQKTQNCQKLETVSVLSTSASTQLAFQLRQRIHRLINSRANPGLAPRSTVMVLWPYLVNLLLQDLFGDLQVLQSHPQLLVLLLQATPLLFHTVQLAVETDGHVLRHLRGWRGRNGGRRDYIVVSNNQFPTMPLLYWTSDISSCYVECLLILQVSYKNRIFPMLYILSNNTLFSFIQHVATCNTLS